jgi:hypothetical protein
LSLEKYDWVSKCPKHFAHGLATLIDMDNKTKSLWKYRVPALLPEVSWHSDRFLWTAVFTSIVEKPTYYAYQDGDAPSLELSDLPSIPGKVAARAKEMIRQEFLKKKKRSKLLLQLCSKFEIQQSSLQSVLC